MILIDLVAADLPVLIDLPLDAIDLLLDVNSLPGAAGEEVALISLFACWVAGGGGGGVECKPTRFRVLNSSESSSSRTLGFETGGGEVLQPVLMCPIEPLEVFERFESLRSIT